MVAAMRAKGLDAREMDFNDLDFPPASFDAVFAMNCLLHVPHANFGGVLASVRRALKPGGVCFLGQYGGHDEEAVYEDDHYEPKRFFAFWADEQIQAEAGKVFQVEVFQVVELDDEGQSLHFQILLLRR
jgi:SAM-dependent methyltransferase